MALDKILAGLVNVGKANLKITKGVAKGMAKAAEKTAKGGK